MDGGTSFGAGKAGQVFDPIGFIIRPQVILKLLSCVRLPFIFNKVSTRTIYLS